MEGVDNIEQRLNLRQEKENLQRVSVKKFEGKGYGLVAKRDFTRGELVFHVFGECVNYATDYTIPIDVMNRVEPRLSQSVAQFMNHSCDPNIYPLDNGRDYVALRDVKAGEELATNYGFLGNFGEERDIDGEHAISFDLTCHCGAKNCQGKLRGYDEFTKEEKEMYKNFVLPFLKK